MLSVEFAGVRCFAQECTEKGGDFLLRLSDVGKYPHHTCHDGTTYTSYGRNMSFISRVPQFRGEHCAR